MARGGEIVIALFGRGRRSTENGRSPPAQQRSLCFDRNEQGKYTVLFDVYVVHTRCIQMDVS